MELTFYKPNDALVEILTEVLEWENVNACYYLIRAMELVAIKNGMDKTQFPMYPDEEVTEISAVLPEFVKVTEDWKNKMLASANGSFPMVFTAVHAAMRVLANRKILREHYATRYNLDRVLRNYDRAAEFHGIANSLYLSMSDPYLSWTKNEFRENRHVMCDI